MKILKFSAQWCGPCKVLKTVYDKVAKDEKYSGIQFNEIDVDEDDDNLTAKYGIRNVPTILVLDDDGSLKERLVGSVSETVIRNTLDQYVS